MSKDIPVYLISLEKDIHRREQLQKQFGDYYQKINLINATDGRLMEAEIFKQHTKSYLEKYSKQMSPGELGCTLSHIDALKEFIASGRNVGLIIEDDIIGDENTIKRLNSLDMSSIDSNAVIICGGQQGSVRQKYIVGKPVGNNNALVEIPKMLYSNVVRTCCYTVTKESAKTIINSHEKCLQLADHWGEILAATDTKLYYIDLFEHPEIPVDSNIAGERTSVGNAKKRKVFTSITKELKRIYRRALVGYYKLLGYKSI